MSADVSTARTDRWQRRRSRRTAHPLLRSMLLDRSAAALQVNIADAGEGNGSSWQTVWAALRALLAGRARPVLADEETESRREKRSRDLRTRPAGARSASAPRLASRRLRPQSRLVEIEAHRRPQPCRAMRFAACSARRARTSGTKPRALEPIMSVGLTDRDVEHRVVDHRRNGGMISLQKRVRHRQQVERTALVDGQAGRIRSRQV